MATVASYLADQAKLVRKIRNSHTNLLKEGRGRITLGSIESRLANLEANMQAFRDNHELLLASITAADAQEDYFKEELFEKIEDEFLDLRGKFFDKRNLLCRPAGASAPLVENPPAGVATQAAPLRKMPPLPLPKFSGKHTEWTSFRDLFKALVVDAPMTGMEKFSHLRDSLSDDPYVLIKNISVTEDNFEGAWQKLVKQYGNNKTLIYTHVREFINLSPMAFESVNELKRLLNGTTDSLDSLKALSSPVDQWDHFSVPLTVCRLDPVSRRAWELATAGDPNPATFVKLRTFLQERLSSLEAIAPAESREPAKTSGGGQPQGRKNTANPVKNAKSHNACRKPPANSANSANSLCSQCNQSHYIASCSVFKGKSAPERLEFAKSNRLCFNCLGRHLAENCKTSKTCFVCHDKHHTLLHDSLRRSSDSAPPSGQISASPQDASRQAATAIVTAAEGASLNSHTASSAQQEAVLLGTAVVKVETDHGKTSYAHALIDPGSEISLIAESLVHRLHLPREEAAIPITGVGNASSVTKGSAQFTVRSRIDASSYYRVEAYILPKLTSYTPKCVRASANWSHLKGLPLADPQFASDAPIELLFGIDLFQLIIQDGVVKALHPAQSGKGLLSVGSSHIQRLWCATMPRPSTSLYIRTPAHQKPSLSIS